jgi:cell division protein FtsL
MGEPKADEAKPNETKPKKMVRRSVAVALGIICIVLVAGLVGVFAYYMPMISDKDNTISSLNLKISQSNTNNTNLQDQIDQLQAWLDGNETLLSQTQTWLNGNITSYETQINLLNSQIAILQNQNQHLQSTIASLNIEINSLDAEIVNLGVPTPPSFWVEPHSLFFEPTNASVGTLFNVTVWSACLDFTFAWAVELGFNSSFLQVLNYGYTAGTTSYLFAGHSTVPVSAIVDNFTGTFLLGESLLGSTNTVNASSNSLFWVEFVIKAVPSVGQTLTCKIDPSFGTNPSRDNTFFLNTNMTEETPVSTAPCAYTFAYAP